MIDRRYPEGFTDLLEFLCEKYGVDKNRVFIEYSSKRPPPIRGGRPGYYDGLLSYRQRDGQVEFLITVFKVARVPILTPGHQFAHLVEDLKSGTDAKLPDPAHYARERNFDHRA